ncbi:DNA repair protein XRCC2 homolog isoform X1 [Eucalyptus grandis]|uniref:DNA repair protein XRCC2 homolog isoform X1 n=2 Tax=Eucalyptus grandis TaxID=71139 RepID=UPI00192EC8B6|nr:DNA repair protein XRCC2 homolog isoform X1 [Eucalyptus grandis]XP_039159143.1 DNA repair protein XRCC2 homolog isoform X1 [Eucalyptus grandis]
MLGRAQASRPSLSLPAPLHRIPLRAGNVVEIAGPSPSAKTQLLIQTAVSCILPKERNGVHYGGLGHSVLFVDLDCRFDVSRLVEMLRHRIVQVNGCSCTADDEEILKLSMRRFSYIRCYDSCELLAALKTLHHRLEKEKESNGIGGHLLMIDSIGAFHWVDRASTSLPLGGKNRKYLSLQNVLEVVVEDLRKLMSAHPMLVIVTKATIVGTTGNDFRRNYKRWPSAGTFDASSELEGLREPYFREYMPPIWQSFVTHRILVRGSDDHIAMPKSQENNTAYVSEWLLPRLNFLDKFVVRNAGVFLVS